MWFNHDITSKISYLNLVDEKNVIKKKIFTKNDELDF